MFDGQKIKPAAPDQVEDDVIIHNKLPEIISFVGLLPSEWVKTA